MQKFEASVIFEANIDACGSCYLVIYGRHVNGYFCAIPNWHISCEMAEPSDTFYNFERLIGAGRARRGNLRKRSRRSQARKGVPRND